MKIALRKITPENFKRCIELKVAESQQSFVAPNVTSIAQSKIYPTYNTRAVYCGDEMVGFVMFGLDTDDRRFYLGRLMIDEKFQGRGYGRGATLEVVKALKRNKKCREIYLSFVPANKPAEKLYRSVGFERTGEMNGDEIVMRLIIERNANRKSQI